MRTGGWRDVISCSKCTSKIAFCFGTSFVPLLKMFCDGKLISVGAFMGKKLITIILFMVFASGAELEAATVPKWIVAECQKRVLFEVEPAPDSGAEPIAILRLLHSGDFDLRGECFFYDFDGKPLLAKALYSDSQQADVILYFDSKKRNGPYSLYYAGVQELPLPDSISKIDKTPVRVKLTESKGRGIPNSRDRAFYVFHNNDAKPFANALGFSFRDIPDIDSTRERSSKRPPSRRGVALHQYSYIIFPQDGIYRFAFRCNDAGILLVDNEVVAERFGECLDTGWFEGDPFFFRAGIHKLEFINLSGQVNSIRVGWTLPDTGKIAELPGRALLSSQEAELLREERKDKTLHPGIKHQVQKAYTFKDTDTVFLQVRFTDVSVNRLGIGFQSRWLFTVNPMPSIPVASAFSKAGGSSLRDMTPWRNSTGDDASSLHFFRGAGVHSAKLELRDNLGFTASGESLIDVRNLRTEEYNIDCVTLGLPAFCYEDDKVAPAVSIIGYTPSSVELSFEWVVAKNADNSKKETTSFDLSNGRYDLQLFDGPASNLQHLTWTLRHKNADLFSGKIIFERYPFKTLPYKAVEDRMLDRRENQIVLVAERVPGKRDLLGEKSQRLLVLDDVLDIPPVIDCERLSFWETLSGILRAHDYTVSTLNLRETLSVDDTFSPLNRVIAFCKAAGGSEQDVLVSMGFQDMFTGATADDFERFLAVVVDVLQSRGKNVILATPPPGYSSLPIREFAQAIMKVADARKAQVADIYTAFMASEMKHRFLAENGMEMTAAGVNFAAQTTAQAILRRNK